MVLLGIQSMLLRVFKFSSATPNMKAEIIILSFPYKTNKQTPEMIAYLISLINDI